jgi:hypothetical protein
MDRIIESNNSEQWSLASECSRLAGIGPLILKQPHEQDQECRTDMPKIIYRPERPFPSHRGSCRMVHSQSGCSSHSLPARAVSGHGCSKEEGETADLPELC